MSTSSSGIMSKPVFSAEDDNPTLDDKLDNIKDQFDYIIDGIGQLDFADGDDIANRLHTSLDEFIQDIANKITE